MSLSRCFALSPALLALVFVQPLAAAEPAATQEIQDLFDRVRLPKIVVAPDGSVLAFAKGCRLLRRSEDGGKSWSAVETIAKTGAGNAIVDETKGHVLIVFPKPPLLLRSTDNGKTWKTEKITFKPNAIGHGTPEGIPVNVGCSESGLTLQHGKHKGRLLMPARIQPPKGNNAQEYWAYNYNTSIYSDDGGTTWQVAEPVQSGTGEGTLAELSDGRIYYNSRCHMAVDARRRIAWSHDGGHRWVEWQVAKYLFEVGGPHYFKYSRQPSYGCNAGLVRVPPEATGGRDVLLFSTIDNPGAGDKNCRVRMTVWGSFDQTKTWPVKRLVWPGPSAYSSLAADRKGNIYLLFERGKKHRYESVAFTRFELNWVTGGKDWRRLLPAKEK